MPLHYPQIYNMTFDVFNKCQKTWWHHSISHPNNL
jgi:hypothetical protein